MKNILYILCILVLISVVYADYLPTITSSQLILRDLSDNSLLTGVYNITYNVTRLSDGMSLWNETIVTILDGGVASNILGLTKPFSYTYFISPVKWRVSINNGNVIEFNETPVPMARVAEYALNVNWTNISSIPSDIADGDDVNTTAEMREAINGSGLFYNISIPCSLISDDAGGGEM